MGKPVRIQPYIPPDLNEKVNAYKAARSLTVSAVVTAALREYFEKDGVVEALVVRRMDGVMHGIGQLQRDLDTLAAGFGRFVRFSFFSAPKSVSAETVGRADSLYADFLARVADQLREGVKFTGLVWRLRGRHAASLADEGAGNGGREGGVQP
jgi:hypothetical protein